LGRSSKNYFRILKIDEGEEDEDQEGEETEEDEAGSALKQTIRAASARPAPVPLVLKLSGSRSL
jgi:hypothetical protein